jgi:chromosome segregation ATPase
LDRTGKFSGDGGYERFLDDITGYISYLNREKDARQFSYPVYENVIVPMTTSERAKHAAELARVTEEATGLDENIKQGTEALKKAKAQIREDRKKVVKECGKLPTKKEKDACKEEADKEMTRFERELLADLGARIENDKEQLGDLKKRITTIKKELKNKKADYSQEAALEVRCGLKS